MTMSASLPSLKFLQILAWNKVSPTNRRRKCAAAPQLVVGVNLTNRHPESSGQLSTSTRAHTDSPLKVRANGVRLALAELEVAHLPSHRVVRIGRSMSPGVIGDLMVIPHLITELVRF